MGKLSISNENHNIMNITWNVKSGKTGMFFGRVETKSQGWTWKVATQITYIPCILAFMANFI